jgi:hypothetical protein
LDEPTPAGKFLGCNHECSFGWAPPMRTDSGSVQPLEGVRRSEDDTRVQYSAVIPGTEANAQGDPASGVFDPTAGVLQADQIRCVRLSGVVCAIVPGVNQHARSSLEARAHPVH